MRIETALAGDREGFLLWGGRVAWEVVGTPCILSNSYGVFATVKQLLDKIPGFRGEKSLRVRGLV